MTRQTATVLAGPEAAAVADAAQQPTNILRGRLTELAYSADHSPLPIQDLRQLAATALVLARRFDDRPTPIGSKL